jgi:hypothetical protein
MATYSNYALRVPASLMDDLRVAAEADGVSMNGFIVQAVAEKVAILRARGMLRSLSPDEQADYLAARAARASAGGLAEILAKAGTADTVLPGDELPEDWLRQDGATNRRSSPL